MRRKPLAIIAVFAVLVVGGVLYLKATPTKQAKDAMAAKVAPSVAPTQAPTTERSGKYVDYTGDVVEMNADTKLLFFHAPWCSQCRALEADIKAKGVPAGVTIIKVDYDSNQTLRKQYGVTLQTTFVRIDDSGGLVEKFVAYDEPTLAAVTKNLL